MDSYEKCSYFDILVENDLDSLLVRWVSRPIDNPKTAECLNMKVAKIFVKADLTKELRRSVNEIQFLQKKGGLSSLIYGCLTNVQTVKNVDIWLVQRVQENKKVMR